MSLSRGLTHCHGCLISLRPKQKRRYEPKLYKAWQCVSDIGSFRAKEEFSRTRAHTSEQTLPLPFSSLRVPLARSKPRSEKTLPTCFVLSARTTKFLFFMFSFMAYANAATSPKGLESELTNIARRHLCSLPAFCIEHSFIYFVLSELFSVICLFWHTLTAHDDTRTRNTRDRDTNSSRQNDVSWCDFYSKFPFIAVSFLSPLFI